MHALEISIISSETMRLSSGLLMICQSGLDVVEPNKIVPVRKVKVRKLEPFIENQQIRRCLRRILSLNLRNRSAPAVKSKLSLIIHCRLVVGRYGTCALRLCYDLLYN